MRAFWTGNLSFGLVNIPVSVYKATESQSIDLDLLHKKDLSRIRYKKVCEDHGHEVTEKEIVRGYQYAKGEYVVLTDEELKRAARDDPRSITIDAFVNDEDIAPLYYDKPYYLEPGKGAGRAYALLHEALEKSGKIGIVRFAFRNRENLGIVRVQDEGLVLIQIRYPKEIRPADINIPDIKVDKKELDLAMQLVDSLSTDFNPEEYKDDYREQVERVIEAKLSGAEVVRPAKEAPPTKVIDLMSALKKSLSEKGKTPAKKASSKRTTARRGGKKVS